MEITDHIAANLDAWMAASPNLDTLKKVAAKYGQAEETIETVTTNAGVAHENKLASWSVPNGVIRVRRLSSRIDQGMVTLMSQSYLTLVQDRKKAKASTAPADL